MLIILILLLLSIFPNITYARVTPNDLYQEKIVEFEKQVAKIADPSKKEKVIQADQMLYDINQKVCLKFDEEMAKLSAILEEVKRRKGVTETVVAYGQGDTPLDKAAYWLNYAAEAVAYQKIQDYTPQITPTNFVSPITYQMNKLKGDLGVLRGKILRAKTEVGKVL